VLELYLQVNAHPSNEGGLAPTTYERYEETINRHLRGRPRRHAKGGTLTPKPYALAVAVVPAASFNGPQAPRAWREQMLREGASKATRERAGSVLSAALSWASSSHLAPEIEINGCSLASEPRSNKRRSLRSGGTGYAPAPRRHGPAVPRITRAQSPAHRDSPSSDASPAETPRLARHPQTNSTTVATTGAPVGGHTPPASRPQIAISSVGAFGPRAPSAWLQSLTETGRPVSKA
jgi:hypothetical protein